MDLIYYSDMLSNEDTLYFNRLKLVCKNSYLISNRFRKPSILKKIEAKLKVLNLKLEAKYDKIYLASFDNLLFSSIVKKYSSSEIYTFDDGTANIFLDSIYFKERSKIEKVYAFFLNALSKKEIIYRVKNHYTIYPNHKNIVEISKTVDISENNNRVEDTKDKNSIKIFIGQPLHEDLNSLQLNKLENFLNKFNIDLYMKHPREKKILLPNIKLLDKKGLIAEEILYQYSLNYNLQILTYSSSVLFNISSKIADKTLISFENSIYYNDIKRLSNKFDCKLIVLDEHGNQKNNKKKELNEEVYKKNI
jgi:beta-galactosamide-alpha-2,3-sialyltransferase